MSGNRNYMRGIFPTSLGLIMLACLLCLNKVYANNTSNAAIDPEKIHTFETLSPAYHIDRIYKSMEGPSSKNEIILSGDQPPQLLWVIGYEVTVVDKDGITPTNQEFLCHNNLDFSPYRRPGALNNPTRSSSRLFTLSQGLFSIDLPGGFGFPIMSNQPLDMTTQVLNHNISQLDMTVRHLTRIRYVRDSDVQGNMIPLFSTNAFVMALLDGENGDFGVAAANSIQQHASCLPGEHAGSTLRANVFKDPFGKSFTGHWVVPLGREQRRTLVTKVMNIVSDTKVHHIAVHAHPFSESLELRDLTANKTIFKSTMKGPKDKIGLTKVDSLSSVEGIPVYKDHDYELVSVYNNTSGEPQDAMATMLLYMQDTEFENPNVP